MSTHNVKTNKQHALLAPVLITNCVAIIAFKTLTYMWMLGKESSSPLDSVDSPNLLTQGFFVSLLVLVSKLHCHRHHGMASDSKNQIRNTTICVEWSISSLHYRSAMHKEWDCYYCTCSTDSGDWISSPLRIIDFWVKASVSS